MTDDLERRCRRSPTVEQVATEAGLTIGATLEAREALAARYASSLSTPAEPDDRETTVDRHHGSIDDGYARAEDRTTVAAPADRALTAAAC